MTVRDAQEGDLGAIAAIWNYYIQTSTHNWRHEVMTPGEMVDWFREHGGARHPVLVVEDGGEVLGFGALSTFRAATSYRYTAEDTIYLAPAAVGRGAGAVLMRALICRGRAGGLKHIVAMIDGANAHSIAFHEKFGFVRVGVFADIGEKNGKTLSCVAMQKRLDE